MDNLKAHPVVGIDYPGTLQEFDDWFPTEQACLDYLQKLRWPDGFICPVCAGRKAWKMETGLYRCSRCKKKNSVIAGTIFQGTRKPLRLWFQAIWYITSQKFGGSALGLKRALGLKSYQTAWSWLHKMRRAMVRPCRKPLAGFVEVDETLVGGTDRGGNRGRGAGRKVIVVIAVEVHEPKGFGRVRMQRVADMSADSLLPFYMTMLLTILRSLLTLGEVTVVWMDKNTTTKRSTCQLLAILPMFIYQVFIGLPRY